MIRVIAYWGLYWGRDTCTFHLTLTIIISNARGYYRPKYGVRLCVPFGVRVSHTEYHPTWFNRQKHLWSPYRSRTENPSVAWGIRGASGFGIPVWTQTLVPLWYTTGEGSASEWIFKATA